MKKLNYLIIVMMLASGLFMQSCNKDQDVQVAEETELQFNITQTDFEFKGTETVPECQDLSMDYVVFDFAGTTYISPIMFANGSFLTKTVKLQAGAGTYALTSFLVYHDVLPIGQGSEDVLIKAAPAVGSEYHDLMVNPLNMDITVEAFKKAQITVDVLCFEDLMYEDFGFTWFELNQVKIERQCFFGDVCTGKVYEYEGSLYANQANGLQMDMPAIMEIKAYKEGVLFRTFSNEAYLGEGQCLEVYWANDEDLVENFTFELYVLLPQGTGMAYQLIDTYNFQDEVGVTTGADGVVDFVLGNCSLVDADFTYPAWVNLPSGSFKMKKTGRSHINATPPESADHGTYMDMTFADIPAGYDISNGEYGTFCGDVDNMIFGQWHDVNVVSSLYPLPAVCDGIVTTAQLQQMNYMFNNLHLYPEFENVNLDDFTTLENTAIWSHIQRAIWKIVDDYGAHNYLSIDAVNNGTGYTPLPGGWATVVFVPAEGNNMFQIQIMPLDP